MKAPVKIADVPPIYPALSRNAHIQGVVILEAVLDAKGRVESVRVLRSVPTLDQAAVDAVQQWRFTPALLNGQPVPVVMTVTVNFTLQDR
jgi:protein TonB